MKQQPINKLFRAALLTAALALLAGASTSCSKEQTPEPGAGATDGVIRIGGSAIGAVGSVSDAAAQDAQTATASQPSTRSMVTATDALPNIYFFRKDATSSTAPSDMYTGGSTATGNRAGDAAGAIAWTSTPAPLYDKNNSYAFLVGCWPGPGSGSSTTVANGLVTWTIDGKTDIMTTDRFPAGTYFTPSTGKMTFQHRLAALEVIVKADAGVSQEIVEALWGKITSIERRSGNANMYYNAAEAGNSYNGLIMGNSIDLALLKGTTYNDAFTPITVPANGSTAVVASGMLSPEAGTITLRINTSYGAPADVTVQFKNGSTNASFSMGYKHTVTLLLSAPDRKVIVADTQVTPWGTGGDGNGSVVPPATAKAPNKGYLDWNNSALLKTGSFNGQTYTIPLFSTTSYDSYTTASNGEKCLSLSSAIEGELPYITLEVAKTDETGTKTWEAAYAACKAKGAGWRLPRMSELMLIYMNKTELSKTPGLTFLGSTSSYWAATEFSTAAAWSVKYIYLSWPYYTNMTTYTSSDKTATYKVRCVKES